MALRRTRLSFSASGGKHRGRSLFFDLFPYTYTGQACKIAGMRQLREAQGKVGGRLETAG